ncbi:uncharacterized protein L969DRAFT_85154 [Mixia osmundae IAM 14324]|uniref:uncharacterized protein n=1 Tax=Mixia osmundae (strain CBS 9802 / IAM 14324 / JCM 22182 / KY 12970) TaxID=764103 RepID=UPI0004A5587A|nr:uncharacterized protein L969DRAFT_85154 [Mixia osmundae IAM 14324]KEI41378.1 hypothetical protein L969DRAFT_85154 [Mixia osmundae IAM 14324]
MVTFIFSPNERVLCFHGPLIYEAKVLTAENWTDAHNSGPGRGPHYKVHYKGWKQTWDEWVPEDRALKYNEESLARQRQLIDSRKAKDRAEREHNNALKASAAAGPSKPKDGSRGTKRGRESGVEQEEEFLKRPEIRLPIPDSLKIQLVEDWESVTKNQQLVPLPRDPTVSKILYKYTEHLKTVKPTDKLSRSPATAKEVVAGLQIYFNKALGNNLLYRFERPQYGDIRKQHDGVEMCDVYGAEHLLRLFGETLTV